MLKFIFSEEFLNSTILFSMPILFAAMAALISNKAGILNINIEGSMAISALVGSLVSFYSQSWIIGICAGIGAGILMSLILAFASLKLKTNHILAGIALNTFTTGLTIFILYLVLGVKGDSSLAPSIKIPDIKIPLLSKIPIIGEALFGQNLLVYLGILSVIAIWFILNKTKIGLRIRAVGENEEACVTVGIKTKQVKVISLIICGALVGIGGSFLSMVYLTYYSVGMVGGRGFIGLAAEAIGNSHPLFTALFSLLFGAVDYFAIGAQSVLKIPYELLNTLPYLMTIFALIIYSIRQNQNQKHKQKQRGEVNEENLGK
jgi:simple sugar transport system permease protein